jgi:hypothetical protein
LISGLLPVGRSEAVDVQVSQAPSVWLGHAKSGTIIQACNLVAAQVADPVCLL